MWTLKLTLRPYEVQRQMDPEPILDDASRLVSVLAQCLDLLPEDIDEYITWSEQHVEVREVDSLVYFEDVFQWIIANISPLKIEFVRDEEII